MKIVKIVASPIFLCQFDLVIVDAAFKYSVDAAVRGLTSETELIPEVGRSRVKRMKQICDAEAIVLHFTQFASRSAIAISIAGEPYGNTA